MVVKQIQWKHKLVGMILLMAVLILFLSFFVIYRIFTDMLSKNNFTITTMSFQQTEKEILHKLENASKKTNSYFYNQFVQRYLSQNYYSDAEHSQLLRQVIWGFSDTISGNSDMLSMAVICADGRVAGAVASSNTVHTTIGLESPLWAKLNQSVQSYPYYTWFGSETIAEILESEPEFSMLAREPVIFGIRAVDYGKGENTSYLLVGIKESAIQDCYIHAQYLQSNIMLLDQNNIVISGIDTSDMGEGLPFSQPPSTTTEKGTLDWTNGLGKEFQIVYYNIPSMDWTLVNQIPVDSYYMQEGQIKLITFTMLFGTLFLLSLFFTLWIQKYARPIDRLMYGMKRLAAGDLSPTQATVSGINELDELEYQFGVTVNQLKTLLEQLQQAEDEKRIEEIRTLQYQINPHFLYNSLNSIRWMAVLNDDEKVAGAITQLAKIVAPILRSPSFFWTVQDEVDFVDGYIKMLTLRFGGAIDYHLDCNTELYTGMFPKFTLQPLIENCFTHGMIPDEYLEIRLSIKKDKDIIHAVVTNTGVSIPFDTLVKLNQELAEHNFERTDGAGIGLPNVNKRLFLLYGETARMWVESTEGNETIVHLNFPQIP